MQTRSTSLSSGEDLRFLVRGVRPIVVYYAFWGRNAWWSTWITRYSEGCIHTKLDSACSYCESQRLQGTVFYINQLPALAFVGSKKALLVTEINTKNVLSRFNRDLLCTLTDLLPVSTMTFEQILHVFRAQGKFWPASFPKENSVITTLCDDESSLEPLPGNVELVARTSWSSGPNYLLGWKTRPSGIEYAALSGIAEHLNAWSA